MPLHDWQRNFSSRLAVSDGLSISDVDWSIGQSVYRSMGSSVSDDQSVYWSMSLSVSDSLLVSDGISACLFTGLCVYRSQTVYRSIDLRRSPDALQFVIWLMGDMILLRVLTDNYESNQKTKLYWKIISLFQEIARQLRPQTIRARFGINKVLNAVHCTDLEEDGLLEVEYFFKILE